MQAVLQAAPPARGGRLNLKRLGDALVLSTFFAATREPGAKNSKSDLPFHSSLGKPSFRHVRTGTRPGTACASRKQSSTVTAHKATLCVLLRPSKTKTSVRAFASDDRCLRTRLVALRGRRRSATQPAILQHGLRSRDIDHDPLHATPAPRRRTRGADATGRELVAVRGRSGSRRRRGVRRRRRAMEA